MIYIFIWPLEDTWFARKKQTGNQLRNQSQTAHIVHRLQTDISSTSISVQNYAYMHCQLETTDRL